MSEPKDDSCRGRIIRTRRRDFLRYGFMSAAGLLAAPVFAARHRSGERALSLSNTHTGEHISAVYWADGSYLDAGLDSINNVLRDHRTGAVLGMDTGLLDLLFVLHSKLGGREAFQVISGYRSPATNAALHARSSGVARNSFHIRGMAIDIRLPGCELADLHQAALSLSAGGVGYYPDSDFVHVDTGPVRNW